MNERSNVGPGDLKRLSSEDLAHLIVDALVDAKLMAVKDFEEAVLVVAEEIEARKAVRDY